MYYIVQSGGTAVPLYNGRYMYATGTITKYAERRDNTRGDARTLAPVLELRDMDAAAATLSVMVIPVSYVHNYVHGHASA